MLILNEIVIGLINFFWFSARMVIVGPQIKVSFVWIAWIVCIFHVETVLIHKVCE